MRELQPYFDKLLLIPGREITTFQGHINLLGTTQFLDFRLGSQQVPDMNVLLRNARKLGALVSVNHPAAPSGEICMGCGWTPTVPVEMSLLDAFEVVNGGTEDPAFSGVPSWEHQLSLGHRLSAIGGSDNHRPFIPLDQPAPSGALPPWSTRPNSRPRPSWTASAPAGFSSTSPAHAIVCSTSARTLRMRLQKWVAHLRHIQAKP